MQKLIKNYWLHEQTKDLYSIVAAWYNVLLLFSRLHTQYSDQQSVILGFIPRAAVNNLKKGQPTPFQEHKAAVIICV